MSADDAGLFVVTWSAYGQDEPAAPDYGIYARIFNADGSNYVDSSGVTPGEFRVNNVVVDNQVTSNVSMDSDGDFVVVWVGPDADSGGIYNRIVALNLSSYVTTGGASKAVSTGLFGLGLNNSTGTTTTPSGTATFTILTPTTGTYANGDTITITWNAGNVMTGSTITLCLDADTIFWNGNEKWIEIDKVSAANGVGSYTFALSNIPTGKYYVGGYLYDLSTAYFTYSHVSSQITVPPASFALTGPASGTYVSGDSVTITWTAAYVSSSDVITLCLDKDTTLFNGNEKWIEVDKVTAANGDGSYTFTLSGVAPGTYYVGGYMYNKSTYVFTSSHLTTTITVPSPSFNLSTSTSSGGFAANQNITINWTAANVGANSVITLCLDKDTTLFNGNEKWIEIDNVAATNGDGSYTYSLSGVAPGTYYVGGYMYDKISYQYTFSHLSTSLTVAQSTFTITSPTSGTYAPGDSVTINWTAANVGSNSVISLCLDKDTTFWNGNEKWIEVDMVAAAEGSGSYTFNIPDMAAGKYYVSGYMYDKTTYLFTYSNTGYAIDVTAAPAASFSLTGPTSGTYAPGDSVTINWTAANVGSNSVITLCLDKDTTFWNGNEKWIEIDNVAAANGSGSYTFTMPDMSAGTYYVGGYMYNKSTYIFNYSHAASPITVPAQTFAMTGPASTTFASGDSVTFTWTAANVTSKDVISLCLDQDTTFWNGNEKWIEIDSVAAANGNGSYTYTLSGVSPGTYYVGGYMYDKSTYQFTYSHIAQAITVSSSVLSSVAASTGTDGANLLDKSSNLALSVKDLLFSTDEFTPSSASQRISGSTETEYDQSSEELLAAAYGKEQSSAVDSAFQDEETWLDKTSANWLV